MTIFIVRVNLWDFCIDVNQFKVDLKLNTVI